MANDSRWVIVWLDGTEENVYGELRVRDGVLEIVEHYGVTYGIKNTRNIPLAQIREWRSRE